EVKYASTMRGWENVYKNYDSQLAGFERTKAMATKEQQEAEVLAWARGQGEAGQAVLDAYARILELNEASRATRERDLVFSQFNGTGILATAIRGYRLAIEREKPDAEREQGYQERDLPTLEGSVRQMERRYVPEMDRGLQRYWLDEYVKLPEGQRIEAVDAWLGGSDDKAIDGALDRLGRSELADGTEARLKWLEADREAFEDSKDPAIRYAVEVMPTLLALEEERKARAGDALLARPVYLQAVADHKASRGEFVYPDANSSLRITFGNVKPYTKLDGTPQKPF